MNEVMIIIAMTAMAMMLTSNIPIIQSAYGQMDWNKLGIDPNTGEEMTPYEQGKRQVEEMFGFELNDTKKSEQDLNREVEECKERGGPMVPGGAPCDMIKEDYRHSQVIEQCYTNSTDIGAQARCNFNETMRHTDITSSIVNNRTNNNDNRTLADQVFSRPYAQPTNSSVPPSIVESLSPPQQQGLPLPSPNESPSLSISGPSPQLGLPTVTPQSNTSPQQQRPQQTNNTGLLISQSAALGTFEPTVPTSSQNQTQPSQGNGGYFGDKLIQEDETKDGWAMCDDKILLIRLQCPVGWKLNIGEDNLDLEHPDDFFTYISIEIEHIFPIDSSEEYMRDTLNAERDENTFINSMEEMEINGNDASVAEYTDGSDKTKQYFIVDSDEYLGYILEYSGDQETYNNFLPMFDRVAQSFEITGAYMTNTDSDLEETDTDFEVEEDEVEEGDEVEEVD